MRRCLLIIALAACHPTAERPHASANPAALAMHRAEKERLLSTYGWVDEKRGIVRIPIDRAIDLVAVKP